MREHLRPDSFISETHLTEHSDVEALCGVAQRLGEETGGSSELKLPRRRRVDQNRTTA